MQHEAYRNSKCVLCVCVCVGVHIHTFMYIYRERESDSEAGVHSARPTASVGRRRSPAMPASGGTCETRCSTPRRRWRSVGRGCGRGGWSKHMQPQSSRPPRPRSIHTHTHTHTHTHAATELKASQAEVHAHTHTHTHTHTCSHRAQGRAGGSLVCNLLQTLLHTPTSPESLKSIREPYYRRKRALSLIEPWHRWRSTRRG